MLWQCWGTWEWGEDRVETCRDGWGQGQNNVSMQLSSANAKSSQKMAIAHTWLRVSVHEYKTLFGAKKTTTWISKELPGL